MRLATIDVGTNTVQLLVVDLGENDLRRVHAAEQFVRLGSGVDASGRIGPDAEQRLRRTLHKHVKTARNHGADQIVAAGTSALRQATNHQAILNRVEEEVGLSVDILSGPAEAAWSFAAACSAFPGLSGSCLVVDVGGGSTELVAGQDPRRAHPDYPRAITHRTSLGVGCVGLTERHFESQPPSATAVDDVVRTIDEALQSVSLPAGDDSSLIGTAGTATALALVNEGPDTTWDALEGRGFVLSRLDVRHWRDRLFRLSVDEIRALHPAAMRGRADVFPAGVLLLDRILAQYDLEALRVSPYELRHGLALRVLSRDPSGTQ